MCFTRSWASCLFCIFSSLFFRSAYLSNSSKPSAIFLNFMGCVDLFLGSFFSPVWSLGEPDSSFFSLTASEASINFFWFSLVSWFVSCITTASSICYCFLEACCVVWGLWVSSSSLRSIWDSCCMLVFSSFSRIFIRFTDFCRCTKTRGS